MMDVVVEVLLRKMVPTKIRELVLYHQEFPNRSELDENRPVTSELVATSE